MNLRDDLLNAAERVARRVARREAAVTDWGIVVSTPPTMVRVAGDDAAQEFLEADGINANAGDTVGLVRYGRRWYVASVLERA